MKKKIGIVMLGIVIVGFFFIVLKKLNIIQQIFNISSNQQISLKTTIEKKASPSGRYYYTIENLGGGSCRNITFFKSQNDINLNFKIPLSLQTIWCSDINWIFSDVASVIREKTVYIINPESATMSLITLSDTDRINSLQLISKDGNRLLLDISKDKKIHQNVVSNKDGKILYTISNSFGQYGNLDGSYYDEINEGFVFIYNTSHKDARFIYPGLILRFYSFSKNVIFTVSSTKIKVLPISTNAIIGCDSEGVEFPPGQLTTSSIKKGELRFPLEKFCESYIFNTAKVIDGYLVFRLP